MEPSKDEALAQAQAKAYEAYLVAYEALKQSCEAYEAKRAAQAKERAKPTCQAEHKACACEHVAHFETGRFTPNGNPGHTYGVRFAQLVHVATVFGSFAVCADCARDCHYGK